MFPYIAEKKFSELENNISLGGMGFWIIRIKKKYVEFGIILMEDNICLLLNI